MDSVKAGLAALALTLLLTPLWIRLAPRVGAIDRPRGRHQHKRPTPTAGGLAIFVGVWVSTLAFLGWPLPGPVIGLLLSSGLLVLLNIYDDIAGLPPLGRLTCQVVLAIVAYVWGVRIEGIGNLGGLLGSQEWVELGQWSGPVTVFWLVLVTNALNWLDGLDGLAAGVAGISAFTLGLTATLSGSYLAFPAVGVLAAAMAGACLGFLRYNFAPARVFMGDTGAMFLGFMLAGLSALGAFKGPTAVQVFVPVLVLGVPLFDSTTAILKRVLNGRNPLVGDRSHIHHRLVDRGMGVRQAVLVIYGLSGALCLLALLLWWRQ
jgi:UDP-GlcNAc:undecaprenyl-phosphate GlcNAc-1-phosphate transferase